MLGQTILLTALYLSATPEEIINRVNSNYKNLQSFSCDVAFHVNSDDGIIPARTHGTLVFEKPHNLRMIGYGSGIDRRLMSDIGSNSEIFWFWSRRTKDKKLYFGEYSKIDMAKMKVVHNPFTFIEMLAVNGISTQFIRTFTTEHFLGVYYTGDDWNKTLYIDMVRNIVVQYEVKNNRGETMVLCRTRKISSEDFIPRQLQVHIPQDELNMTVYFYNIKSNVNVDKSKFKELPGISPIIKLTP